MSSKEKDDDEIKEGKVVLNFEQVKELANEVISTSHQAFLIKRKAVKVDEKGVWEVMQYDGLTGKPAVYGYNYPNDVPFIFWNEILKQVDYFIRKKEEKKKFQQQAEKELELV